MKRAIFLDRDGTINHDPGYISDPGQFVLIDGAAEAIRRLNDAGYVTVVVTNQSAIARGLCTVETLHAIHNKMKILLAEKGAHIDRIYFCPHHPDGVVTELKITCVCRKPETGMILQAQRELNIDLTQSWMIGDTTADMMLAKRAGVRSILVSTGHAGSDKKYDAAPDFVAKDLAGAVGVIIQ